MDDDELDRAAATAAAVLRETGPLPWPDLRAALADRGVDVDEELDLDLDLVLVDDHDVHVFGRGTLVATGEQVRGGRVATHRLDAVEVAHGYLTAEPDLALVLSDMRGLRLGGPGGQAIEVVFGPRKDLELDERAEVLLGPPGWLGGVQAGEVVGVRVDGVGLSVERVDPQSDLDLPERLAEAFGETTMTDGTSFVSFVAGLVSARDPGAFSVPRRPLAELLAAAGLVVEGEAVGPPGFDWAAHWESRRLEHAEELAGQHRLDELDGRLMADLVVRSVLHGTDGDLDADGWEAAAVALAAPAVTTAFCSSPDGQLGVSADEESVGRLRRFAEAVVAHDERRAPAGAHVVLARCAEFAGDLAAAEAHTAAALQIDPDFSPALADLAFVATIRGQPSRAAASLRRAGLDRGGLVELLDHFAAPGDVAAGRNEPCPCGSSRKHKLCCGRFAGHSLRRRSFLLWRKAVLWADRGPGRRARVPLAMAAAGVDDPDDAPDAMVAAMFDGDLAELQVFDGGGLASFADACTPLLPDDEAALLARWAGTGHRVWELVDRPGDGEPWTLRDSVSGEIVEVADLPGAPSWATGQRVLGVAAPLDLDGARGLFGAVRILTESQVEEIVAVLTRGGGADALAAAVIGPTLAASAAMRSIVGSARDEADRRLAWVFPGDDITVDDLEGDPELLDVLLDEWGFGPAEVGETDDPDQAAAGPFVTALFKMTAGQIVADDPPEVWATAERLVQLGHDRVEVLQMLASTLVEQIRAMVYEHATYDRDRHVADLATLPDSFLERRSRWG